MTTRILLADDHELVREGFRALLDSQDDMQVVAQVSDGRAAVDKAVELRPDVVILDIAMPGLGGIDATARIRRELPRTRIIGLSVHEESRYVTEMLKAGASGYLVKTCAFRELIEAVQAVRSGETYLSSKVAGQVVSTLVSGAGDEDVSAGAAQLSPREREVLSLLAEGKTSKQIARDLDVTPRTIDLHRQNIMKKLDLNSVAELTKFAIREGLTSLH